MLENIWIAVLRSVQGTKVQIFSIIDREILTFWKDYFHSVVFLSCFTIVGFNANRIRIFFVYDYKFAFTIYRKIVFEERNDVKFGCPL